MKTKISKLLSFVLVICMVFMAVPAKAEAATVKINKKSAVICVGESVQLKITGTNKKIAWSSSNKKVARVTSKGKVTGAAKGTAAIVAKAGGKKYTCKVTVNPKNTVSLKISSIYLPEELTKKDVQAAVKENGYISGKISSDGSVTYVMSSKVYKDMLKDYKRMVNEGIDEMLSGEEAEEAFEEITYNDEMSEFNIIVNENYNEFTPIYSAVFFIYGGYYQVITMVPEKDKRVVVNYIDKEGTVLYTSDSAALEEE